MLEATAMRIVALEEHVSLAPFNAELEAKAPGSRGANAKRAELEDTDQLRLASMDANGITFQVLSVAGPGAALLPPDAAPEFTQRYNDELATIVARHPGRFAAFAHLPMTAPQAAADELERAVRERGLLGALISGQTRGKFLDDPSYEPLLARAEALDVPIYIDPASRRKPYGRPTTTVSARTSRRCSPPRASAGTPKPRCTCCAWCWPAPSTAIPTSRSSSGTWAKDCPRCSRAATIS